MVKDFEFIKSMDGWMVLLLAYGGKLCSGSDLRDGAPPKFQARGRTLAQVKGFILFNIRTFLLSKILPPETWGTSSTDSRAVLSHEVEVVLTARVSLAPPLPGSLQLYWHE